MEGNAPDDPPSPIPGAIPSQALTLELLAKRVADLEQQVALLKTAARPRTSLSPDLRPNQRTDRRTDQPVTPPRSSVIAKPQNEQPVLPPPFVDASPTPAPTPFAPRKSLEDRLGSQVFNLIGIVALMFGAAWALKLAIEHGLVGPAARVLIGLAAGAGLILWSELFRRRGLAAFSYSLKAVGTGILYLSLWAAFQLYGLLSAPVALGAMILVTAWNGFMAFSQDAELLAAYALVGGLLTPMLLSTGGDHETFLFTYIAFIDLAVVALQRYKSWPRLLPPAFLATAVYFTGYFFRFFHPYVYGRNAFDWDTQSTETALFACLFFALFAVVSTRFWTPPAISPADPAAARSRHILIPVLIPLANAAFVSLALYAVFAGSGLRESRAWLMVALAAVFLGLMRLQSTALATAMHLACAVVFLTVAIPLKASGHTLTTAWLVEGLVLFWAGTRFRSHALGAPPLASQTSEQRSGAPHLASEMWDVNASQITNPVQAPSRVLAILSAAGYLLGLISVVWHWTWSYGVHNQQPFFNANLGSALVAVAVLAGAAWLSLPRDRSATGPEEAPENRRNPVATLIAALSAIDLVALLLALREFTSTIQNTLTPRPWPTPFANPNFATALVGLALFAATSWASWRLAHMEVDPAHGSLFRLVTSVDLVLFNLIAILAIERQIRLIFFASQTRSDADLGRSLAISAFLMVYGATLLAIGFWRRAAFVRWQALILILFTIAKVFLYDISGLSAGYRVASFLALGALLLTVSFAYQKDWLSLKTAPDPSTTAHGDQA